MQKKKEKEFDLIFKKIICINYTIQFKYFFNSINYFNCKQYNF